jgi:hypothetical protein
VEAIVSDPKDPWYHTVQQRHYTKAYPKTQEFQELFGDLREARAHGWQLTALVQQHDRLTTTFTRYPSGSETDQRLSEQTW